MFGLNTHLQSGIIYFKGVHTVHWQLFYIYVPSFPCWVWGKIGIIPTSYHSSNTTHVIFEQLFCFYLLLLVRFVTVKWSFIYTLTQTPHPRQSWSYSRFACTVWIRFQIYRPPLPHHLRLPLFLLLSPLLKRSEPPGIEQRPTHTQTTWVLFFSRTDKESLKIHMKSGGVGVIADLLLVGVFAGSFFFCRQSSRLI